MYFYVLSKSKKNTITLNFLPENYYFSAVKYHSILHGHVCLKLFHINRATVLTYDLAGAACRRQIADNFSNIQTGPIMS